MLHEEAKWIGSNLKTICGSKTKVLNVGSSSLLARTILQPHMEEFVFAPLRKSNVEVIHTDIQQIEGVDLVGDLTDQSFIEHLKALKFDCILCSNLLEHIEDIEQLLKALTEILPIGGYYVFSVPHIYPYHNDPIDTMFRPSVEELKNRFPILSLVRGESIIAKRTSEGKIEKNYFEILKNSPKLTFRIFVRCFLPFYKFKVWKYTISDVFNMFKPFQVTCVVLKK